MNKGASWLWSTYRASIIKTSVTTFAKQHMVIAADYSTMT